MGLEMEFDERISKPEFRSRFYDYINVFRENEIWQQFPVAYYEGGGAWMKMVHSGDPELQKMVETLGDIVVKRQKQADNIK